MRKQLLAALVVVAALGASTHATAEPLGRHFELTPFGGWTFFDGKISSVTGNPLTDDLYFGGRLGYQFHRLLGIEAAAGFTPTAEDFVGGADVDYFHASGNLVLTPWSNRYGGPFLFAGAGSAQTKVTGQDTESNMGIEYGGGLRFWMSDAIGVRFEARNISSEVDAIGGAKETLDNLVVGGGLTFALGGTPRDTDGDGVPDKRDACPDSPRGSKVDARGCPTDSDADGVFDGLDQCEGTPKGATVDANGCPSDADGDGVFDGLDTCAETPKGATVDAKGCPSDADSDKVFDGLDQCPNTPTGATVDDKGCPSDSDGDGVFDGLDQCEATPAGLRVDDKGCPIELVERETELLDTGTIRLQNVNFETAKSDILAESFPTLDAVAALMVKWPQLKIEIGGHTDGRGSATANQQLSLSRAKAVETYLLGKQPTLKDEQFTVKGYGESKPLAPNDGEVNWAKNRRVEFVVLNKDVLKKEVERRRLLEKPATPAAPADSTQKN
ncbi:MAG: OmpA family protein [Candidatus Eisenbacteria bacterium]|uniref:OmpA family protein n=1 Tax=Eiseniibacteriota bacterium TaxID=2212470 RepID=A0A849SER8_UNCEI|nr:OmpA family protein [Candidatus Eisenbacteria bacterium]